MYSTSANLKIIGRSIAIDLSDANIDNCRVADPHTILFFRKTPEWTEEELETLQKIRLDLLKNNKVAFSLNEWGPNSKLVEGSEIREFSHELLKVFPEWQNDRPLHVCLNPTPPRSGGRRL